ncbi:hypothetical protein WMY93_029602 [Mugilogobius chulae]|uniref:Uncharacterized protein n=1 Tax=Mugilogobius chulae TaxID=88201 RepID=A0AAW0MKC9_9GOBI
MAPLSSDEEEPRDDLSSTADTPVRKRGPGRPRSSKNKPQSPCVSPESAANAQNQRRKTERAARLPLRYLLDYDLESHDQLSANKKPPENGEGVESSPKQEESEKKVLSPNPDKLANAEDIAAQREGHDWPNSASIVVYPALDKFTPRPLSPGEVLEPPVLPLIPKNVPDQAENADVKEEPINDENTDLESSEVDFKHVKIKKEAADLIGKIKQEDDTETDCSESDLLRSKDGILTKTKHLEAALDENNASQTETKRNPGRPKKRPRKMLEIKQEKDVFKEESDFEMAEQLTGRVAQWSVLRCDIWLNRKTGTSRRKSECFPDDAAARRRGKRRQRQSRDGEKGANPKQRSGNSGEEGLDEQFTKRDSGEVREHRRHLRASGQRVRRHGSRRQNGGFKRHKSNAKRGAKDAKEEKTAAQKVQTELEQESPEAFLVFRDDETSVVTLIPPCAVKLQKMSRKEEERLGESDEEGQMDQSL